MLSPNSSRVTCSAIALTPTAELAHVSGERCRSFAMRLERTASPGSTCGHCDVCGLAPRQRRQGRFLLAASRNGWRCVLQRCMRSTRQSHRLHIRHKQGEARARCAPAGKRAASAAPGPCRCCFPQGSSSSARGAARLATLDVHEPRALPRLQGKHRYSTSLGVSARAAPAAVAPTALRRRRTRRIAARAAAAAARARQTAPGGQRRRR